MDLGVGIGDGEDGGGRERRTLAAEGDHGGNIARNHGMCGVIRVNSEVALARV